MTEDGRAFDYTYTNSSQVSLRAMTKPEMTCPLIWKSQLQSTIALSTAESEYFSLSIAMRPLLSIRSLIVEAIEQVNFPEFMRLESHHLRATVFEDSTSAFYPWQLNNKLLQEPVTIMYAGIISGRLSTKAKLLLSMWKQKIKMPTI